MEEEPLSRVCVKMAQVEFPSVATESDVKGTAEAPLKGPVEAAEAVEPALSEEVVESAGEVEV